MRNRKGALTDLLVMLISFFSLAIIICLSLYLFNAFVPALHQVTTTISDPTGQINQSLNQMTIDISAGFSTLNWFAMINVASIIIFFFITNAFIKAHPAFIFVYFISIGIAAYFAVYISNTFSSLLTNPIFAGLSTTPSLNYFMLHLPLEISIIGFIGAIFLFTRIDFENI